jgi:hypothetical protein
MLAFSKANLRIPVLFVELPICFSKLLNAYSRAGEKRQNLSAALE